MVMFAVSWLGLFRLLERTLASSAASVNSSRRRYVVKPLCAESKRSDLVVPLAATLATPEIEVKKVETEDYEKLVKGLEKASPLEIMDKALETFGNDIAIAFRTGIENLLHLENRSEPWIVVLYAPWCQFCQAMEAYYVERGLNQ